MTMNRTGLAMLLAAATTACSTASVSEFETSDINAQMSAVALGDGKTKLEVSLYDSEKLLTFLQLTSDDNLEATAGGQTKELSETSLLGAVTYSATFDLDAAETEFRVRLERGSQADAPDSAVKLPAPFALRALAKQSFSRAEQIDLAWDSAASPDPMRLDVSGECIDAYSAELGTSATSFSVPAGALHKRESQNANEPVADECEITLTLKRSRSGQVDSAFHGGSFGAQQRRALTARSAP